MPGTHVILTVFGKRSFTKYGAEICSSKPLRGSFFLQRRHGKLRPDIPVQGGLPFKDKTMKEQTMSAKLYDRMLAQLQLSGYRERTCQSYLKAVMQLQRFCNKPLSRITQADLRDYWLACRNDYGWRPATLRISYSGIKFFFSRTLVRNWKLLKEVRFKREQTLPSVLSAGEVKRIICALPTLQSKVFYVTLY
jgi:hypothetical protein